MRLRYRLAGAGVLLMLTVGGTVRAAPIYNPTPVVAPEYELGRLESMAEEGSDDPLWQIMTNPGSGEWALGGGLRTTASTAGISWFDTPAEYEAWVGEHERITFVPGDEPVSLGEVLHTQYTELWGVTFTDAADPPPGDDDTVMESTQFVLDDFGANGHGGFEIVFTEPQTHMGVDFPGALRIELYDGETWVGSHDFGSEGQGFFGCALLPDEATFDRVILTDWYDGFAFVDDLRYDVVPEPRTFFLLGVASLVLARWTNRGRKLR